MVFAIAAPRHRLQTAMVAMVFRLAHRVAARGSGLTA
jgi:hypothetical protein